MNHSSMHSVLIIILGLFLCACSGPELMESKSAIDMRLDALSSSMNVQERIEQLYYKTDGNERLAIPQFTGSDGPHGIGNGAKGFSCFPVNIAMSATWDPLLIAKVGRAISMEQAARGRDRIAGPTLDMLIDPRIGRAPETIGEDPFLGGRIVEAFIQGQNTTSVFGSIKHYNLNTYEINRRTNDYLSDQRSLVEFWGYHWKRAIQQGGAMSIMCAYNWVNGDKCAENKFLIKDLLRDKWGFEYYTMSDWGGFKATEKALKAELDFCEGNDLYIKELPTGVESGTIDTTLINRATRNILRTKLMSGMIDGKPEVDKAIIDSEKHRALVYESGLKGLVLLKNEEQTLPLQSENIKKLAVIGPNAAVLPLDGNSSSKVVPSYTITVKDALVSALGADRIDYVMGCNIFDQDKSQFSEAIQAAKNADYVVFVGGLDATVEGEGWFLYPEADEAGGGAITKPDRPTGTVLLPGLQNELIKEIAKVNPNISLVVISGGTCSVTPIIDDIKGLLYAFYPGQEGGKAIADVLLGNYNPSGKLPASIPKSDDQIRPITPNFKDMVIGGAGYRWFDEQNIEPEFAFGAGISYTTFEFSNIRSTKELYQVGEPVEIVVDVTNIGDRAGEEVTQLYLSIGEISPNVKMPKKQLRGFEKLLLDAGETKTVSFELTPEDFYVYDESSSGYFVPSGKYIAKVGGSSDRLVQEVDFVLQASTSSPELSVVNIRTLPAFPKEGDTVIFLASLINNGTSATKVGEAHTIRFYVDDQEVAIYHSQNESIQAGSMILACAESTKGEDWKAVKGKFQIKATVEIDDLIESNNSAEGTLTIPNGRVIPNKLTAIL